MSKYIDVEPFENALMAVQKRSDVISIAEVLNTLMKYPAAGVVEVVRCAHCIYWDRETLRHQFNDFRDWNEAECKVLAERDGYNEINRYTEGDDYCSYGERRDE